MGHRVPAYILKDVLGLGGLSGPSASLLTYAQPTCLQGRLPLPKVLSMLCPTSTCLVGTGGPHMGGEARVRSLFILPHQLPPRLCHLVTRHQQRVWDHCLILFPSSDSASRVPLSLILLPKHSDTYHTVCVTPVLSLKLQ